MKTIALAALVFWGLAIPLVPANASGRAEGSIQATWTTEGGVASVVVDADEQDIVVTAGPRLTCRLIGNQGDGFHPVREGDAVTLTVRANRGWFSWPHRSSRLELVVPEGLALDLATASGAVVVRVSTRALKVRSASGDIEAPRGGRDVDADSTSGTLRLRGFHGEARVASVSGDILVEDLVGSVRASTLSGNIDGRSLTLTAPSRFTTTSGDIHLSLPALNQLAVEADSTSGDLEVGATRAQGHLKTGTGTAVVVQAVSGDIVLR